jgi:hypothetical protein
MRQAFHCGALETLGYDLCIWDSQQIFVYDMEENDV